MHLLCMTRGEQSAVRDCMHDLSAQFWEFKTTRGTHINTIVQPIQLWSLVIPKEHLSVLQKTIFTNDFVRYHGKEGKPYARDSAAVYALRKMLRAKKCPPIPKNTNFRFIRKENVEFLPIGIKEDNTIHSTLKNEGL